jgi:hypothetical protein
MKSNEYQMTLLFYLPTLVAELKLVETEKPLEKPNSNESDPKDQKY